MVLSQSVARLERTCYGDKSKASSISAQATGSSPQLHLHASPSSPSILSSHTFRTIPCNHRDIAESSLRTITTRTRLQRHTPPYLDDASIPMPLTDPMTDLGARSTHPPLSDPYRGEDTQPIVKATGPAPTAAADTSAAMTAPFSSPSPSQTASSSNDSKPFQTMKNKGAGVGLSCCRYRRR